MAKTQENHGVCFCPVILGSDKTTVSVASGQNDYYPLYISNGLIHNHIRRAHRNGVSLVAFLAIPRSKHPLYISFHSHIQLHIKADREHNKSEAFRNFRREVFHESLRIILGSLHPGMTTPKVIRYADGHYRQMIYGLGPYIADYPEQALLTCIVQGWCPR